MSGHADRIGSGIGYGTTRAEHDAAFAALDALLAEHQRLRDALELICEIGETRDVIVAREALAGDTECVCGEINTRHCPVHGQGDTE